MVKVELKEGEDFAAASIDNQGDWVIAHLTERHAIEANYRAIPRSNIKQIIVMGSEDDGRISWED